MSGSGERMVPLMATVAPDSVLMVVGTGPPGPCVIEKTPPRRDGGSQANLYKDRALGDAGGWGGPAPS